MDGRFEVRREELLAQARVSAEDWTSVSARLEVFVEPFVARLTEDAQRQGQRALWGVCVFWDVVHFSPRNQAIHREFEGLGVSQLSQRQ